MYFTFVHLEKKNSNILVPSKSVSYAVYNSIFEESNNFNSFDKKCVR